MNGLMIYGLAVFIIWIGGFVVYAVQLGYEFERGNEKAKDLLLDEYGRREIAPWFLFAWPFVFLFAIPTAFVNLGKWMARRSSTKSAVKSSAAPSPTEGEET